MKQSLANILIFSTFGLACGAAAGGCSGDPTPATLGGGNTPFGGTSSSSGGASAGTGVFPSSGSTSGGSGNSTAGTSFGTAGTFASGGTFGSGGTATAGTGTGGSGTAGTGTAGTAAGGASAGGTGGTDGGADFPANCPMPSATAHSADKLTRTCWKASASACSLGNAAPLVNPPSNALDADQMTRYSTGVKMTASKMFMFDVDMGKAVMINGVSTSTLTATDIPPQIEVDVSTDGTAWTPVACGTNSATADISFAPVSARYVRLVQHGTADAWWSMVDLNVYRSGADDTCGAGATATACTSIGAAFPDTCCGQSNKL